MQSRWADDATPQTPALRDLSSAQGRENFKENVLRWCREQSRATLLWRGALWLYLLVAGAKLVWNPAAGDIFGLITFAIHEMGHVLFGFLGTFLAIAGGSIAQLLAPMYALSLFWRQRDYFALSIGGYWLASSSFNLAVYIGDARAQQLELVSPFAFGDEPIHDWNYLLTHLHILPLDITLSWLVRLAATLLLVASLAWSAWILKNIARR
jgi:hypothetical protein